MVAPSRSAQMVNCSTAAARNVSAAPSTTVLPSAMKRFASLAIEVVLPAPLTPATMITVGPGCTSSIGWGVWFISSLSLSLTASRNSCMCITRARNLAPSSLTIASAGATPMSVLIRAARTSSRNASSTSRPSLLNRSRTSVLSSCVVFFRPCLNLSNRPMVEIRASLGVVCEASALAPAGRCVPSAGAARDSRGSPARDRGCR